jgi:hypothetical protein
VAEKSSYEVVWLKQLAEELASENAGGTFLALASVHAFIYTTQQLDRFS